MAKIAESFRSIRPVHLESEIREELIKALRFANSLDTPLSDPLSFTDPKSYGAGAKDGIFGKLLDSYLEKRISLGEFGRLVGKFSETCTEREWADFFKPVLEQNLRYEWTISSGITDYLSVLNHPLRERTRYTMKTLPKNYYVGKDAGAMPLDIRIGKGTTDIFAGPCKTSMKILGSPSDEFVNSEVQYGIRTTDWVRTLAEATIDVNSVDDFFLWDDHWNGRSLRRTYHERRILAENMFEGEMKVGDLTVSDFHGGNPSNFHKTVRILFEQGTSESFALVIHDADSTKNLLGDVWRFDEIRRVPILEVHGDDQWGMTHVVVEFNEKKYTVHQGDKQLTLNARRKIYQERDTWIGKMVALCYDTITDENVPNYAYWKIGKD